MGTEKRSNNRNDNEDNKFVNNSDNKVAVSVVGEIDTSNTGPVPTLSGSIFSGIDYDALSASYPTSTTEVYRAYEGGLSGTLLATVTVTYQTDDKEFIVSVVRS